MANSHNSTTTSIPLQEVNFPFSSSSKRVRLNSNLFTSSLSEDPMCVECQSTSSLVVCNTCLDVHLCENCFIPCDRCEFKFCSKHVVICERCSTRSCRTCGECTCYEDDLSMKSDPFNEEHISDTDDTLTCENCKVSNDKEELTACDICLDVYLCSDCVTFCESCDSTLCKNHLLKCPNCEVMSCHNCKVCHCEEECAESTSESEVDITEDPRKKLLANNNITTALCCDNCGYSGSVDEMVTCDTCLEGLLCDNCMVLCETCDAPFCMKHMKACEKCRTCLCFTCSNCTCSSSSQQNGLRGNIETVDLSTAFLSDQEILV